MKWSSLDIVGYKDQPVPNSFIIQPGESRHLGIILPGLRHSADMADLYYAGRVLLDKGADLLRVEYAYSRTHFMTEPEREQAKWLSTDVFAACNAGLSHRSYNKITLIGKSLGTLAMGHLLADERFQGANCVWSTPLITVEWLCLRIKQFLPRSLFIIGTADIFYKPDILKQLQETTGGHALVIEGANHGLEIPDDIPKSLAALKQIIEALQEFLIV